MGQSSCGMVQKKASTNAPCENYDVKDTTMESCRRQNGEAAESGKKGKADIPRKAKESGINYSEANNNEKGYGEDCVEKEKNWVIIYTPDERGLYGLREKIKKYPTLLKSDDNIIDFEKIFADEVKNREVVLEDIFVSVREISLLIAVSCNEQHPKVTVRYTTDSWETVLNKEAKRFPVDNDDNKPFQRFFLMLNIPPERDLKFAVRSEGDLGTFWDNHYDKNFSVDHVKENGSEGRLLARFIPWKHAMFEELAKRKSVTMKNASLKDGKVIITVATDESSIDPPGVLYTLDNWKSSNKVENAECKSVYEKGQNISEIRVNIPKDAKMMYTVFWRHEGLEFWDNNNGKNFEIQG